VQPTLAHPHPDHRWRSKAETVAFSTGQSQEDPSSIEAENMPIEHPLVSIVINNHNYGRFLSTAIGSALSQTYDRCEVVVVDDGSTDQSSSVINNYGARIVGVVKENGGQASALNAGFERSRGDVVIFLDADDALLPHAVRQVVDVFAKNGDLAKVQFRLELIDEQNRSLGRFIPAARAAMPNGNLRACVLLYPDDLAWSAMSGNAFPAWLLQKIMPISTERYPDVGADVYLSNVAPLFGQVASIHDVGGLYRVHAANAYHRCSLDLRQTRRMIRWSLTTHGEIRRHAAANGTPLSRTKAIGSQSLTLLAQRMMSLKLNPSSHPVPSDTRVRLAAAGLAATMRRRDKPFRLRLLYAAWFVAMSAAPRKAARRLAESLFFPESKGQALGLQQPRRSNAVGADSQRQIG
jgi:GT2 family glycosyltransferase